jgi:hypothetical protein
MSDNGPSFSQLDAELDRLKAAYPGWRLWYVPRVGGPVAWCGHPLPVLNGYSPEELAEYIEEADAERAAALVARNPGPGESAGR